MQWFKASGWGHTPVIKAVEVIGETECFLIIPNRWQPGKGKPDRIAKSAEGERYFPTWEGARDFLVEQMSGRVEYHREGLERANAALEGVRGWKKPENAAE